MTYSAGMRGTPSKLRGTALIAAGALTLHELRYVIAAPAAEQAGAGHGYLPLAGLACALVLALAFAQLVSVAARARRTGAGEERGLSFGGIWLLCASALAGIFIAQELLEAALDPGRPGVVAGALGAGAWVCLPLALLIGAIVAFALVAARAVVVAAARRGRRAGPSRRRGQARSILPRAHRPQRPSLATHLYGRAPPLPA